MSLDQLQESVSVGGPDLVVYRREVGGAPLRVAILGRFGFAPEAFVDMATRVVAGERAFWGGKEGPFLVALAPLTKVEKSMSIRGEGRGDAFAIQAGEDTPLDNIKVILAHEYFHTWNPGRLGGMHDGDAERADYWFSEGFTDFYARRLALRMGVFSLDEFVAEWNAMLRAYAASPVRGEPNSRVVADFWNDRRVEKLPYQRGAMLAAIWDDELRVQSGGKVGLDDVVRAMRARAAALGPRAPKAPELFAQTIRDFGLDVRGDVARIVDQGGAAVLPADAFGGCLRVATGKAQRFELGYTVEKKTGGRFIAKVDRETAAYAAGLRSGMKLAGESGYPGDPARPWKVWVIEDDQQRLVSYLPAADGTQMQQQLELPKDLTPEARAACAKAVGAAR
jgi:predicted metalloprotease with PDZ domain